MTASEFLKTRSLRQYAGLLMITAGLLAFVYQAWKNAKTAVRYSEGYDVVIDAIGGIAPELFVAAAAVGIIACHRSGSIKGRKSLLMLMMLCIGFGMFSSFQQISVGRSIRSAEQSVAQGNLAGRTEDLGRARAELAAYASTPSVATANSALEKLKARKGWTETRQCAEPGRYMVLCRQVADAKGLIGRAEQKERLESRIAALQSTNERTQGTQVAVADPGAIWLSRRAGMTVEDAQYSIAFFMAFTMMMVGILGVHYGLVVYGHDDEPRPLVPSAEIIPATFPRATDLTVGRAILPKVA